jgi:uncharacterized membrane protein
VISLTSIPSDTSPPALDINPAASTDHEPRSWTQRVIWTLVGVVIINWSITLFGPASYYPPLAVLVVIIGFWGLSLTMISWLDLDSYPALNRWSNQFAWSNAILVVILMGVWTYIQIHNNPGYSTDELSFDQYAAQLVAHGFHNPYVHSMQPAAGLFRLGPDSWTYTITGQRVTAMSYPSLSFLVYVPFILLGWGSEIGVVVNVMGWAIAVLLMFKLLPRNIRAAALVLSSIDVYLSFAAGGVTDMLYIPLLILAAYKWDRFGTSRSSYLRPVALGLAMAVKQTPWPVLAFVLCAIAWDEFDRSGSAEEAARRAGRYLAVVLAVFFLPNLPYIIASPHAWFSGVLTPFVKNMVPSGQGLISLTLFAHLGGGSLFAYTLGLAFVGLLLLFVFVGTYPLLRPATFMLPTIAYMFGARSQTNYLIALVPVGLVGAATAGRAIRPALGSGSRFSGLLRSRRWGVAITLTGILSAGAIIYGFAAPSPLSLKITGIRTTGYLGGINLLKLKVHNGTGKTLKPAYTVQTTHGDTTFWDVVGGPKTLAPGASANVNLVPANVPAQPGLGDGFSVLAFTDQPEAVSVSHRFLLSIYRTAFVQQAFNDAVPVGKHIKLQVEILNHYDRPVNKAGIPVYMAQLLYTPLGVRSAAARIDGHKPGKGQIEGFTNRHGVATFDIVGTEPRGIPTSFSAHLFNESAQYVYGSTGQIYIRFKRNPALERKQRRERERKHHPNQP